MPFFNGKLPSIFYSHHQNTISHPVRGNVVLIVYTYSFTFLFIHFACKLAKSKNVIWVKRISIYNVFIINYCGSSPLKVTFRNYEKTSILGQIWCALMIVFTKCNIAYQTILSRSSPDSFCINSVVSLS